MEAVDVALLGAVEVRARARRDAVADGEPVAAQRQVARQSKRARDQPARNATQPPARNGGSRGGGVELSGPKESKEF